MKKFGAIAVLIVVGIVCFLLFKPGHPASDNPPVATPTATIPADHSLPATSATAPLVSTPATVENFQTNPSTSLGTVAPGRANSPATATAVSSLPPLTVLDNARVVLHNYRDRFGENPVGDNAEITAALMGENPKQVNFVTAESGLRVNAQGELIDAWGTPFFFHQLSGQLMEIRSAGEDRKMWTFDDLVTR